MKCKSNFGLCYEKSSLERAVSKIGRDPFCHFLVLLFWLVVICEGWSSSSSHSCNIGLLLG